MKKLITIFIVLFGLISFNLVFATSGACSYHGGVDCSIYNTSNGNAICKDGVDSSVSYLSMEECKPNFISCSQYTVRCSISSIQQQCKDSLASARGIFAAGGMGGSGEASTMQNQINTDCQDKINSCQSQIDGYESGYNNCLSIRQKQIDLYSSIVDKIQKQQQKNEDIQKQVLMDLWCKGKGGSNYDSINQKCNCNAGSTWNQSIESCSCSNGYVMENNECELIPVLPPPIKMKKAEYDAKYNIPTTINPTIKPTIKPTDTKVITPKQEDNSIQEKMISVPLVSSQPNNNNPVISLKTHWYNGVLNLLKKVKFW